MATIEVTARQNGSFQVTTQTSLRPAPFRDTYDAHPSRGGYRVSTGCQVFDGEVEVRADTAEEAVRKVAERVAAAIESGQMAWQFDLTGL